MKTVVFLSFNLAGHLNPTVIIANQFKYHGYEVYYAGLPELLPFTLKNNFKFHLLRSLPYAIGINEILPHNSSEKWFENIANRFSDIHLNTRKNEIENLVAELNPAWIFLDEFNCTDYLFFHPFQNQIRIIIFQTKFPSHFHQLVPPLNLFAFPSDQAVLFWQKHLRKKKIKRFWNWIKYLGHDDLSLLNRAQKKMKMDAQFKFTNKNSFKPTIENVEEWFLVPQLLDFNEQTLKPWQKYIGPMVDINKQESLPAIYSSFLERFQLNNGAKLVYCSFGSVANQHIQKTSYPHFKNFLNILLTFIHNHPNVYLILSLDKFFLKFINLNDLEKMQNVLLLDFVPQIDALKQADAFITHAGMTSIFEAIYTETPMLLFPLNNKWDQPGNAARVVRKNLGIKLDLSLTFNQFEKAVFEVVENQDFKKSIRFFKQELEKMYTEQTISNYKI